METCKNCSTPVPTDVLPDKWGNTNSPGSTAVAIHFGEDEDGCFGESLDGLSGTILFDNGWLQSTYDTYYCPSCAGSVTVKLVDLIESI